METTEKKPNGGYSRLKIKYAKLRAETDVWKDKYFKKKDEHEVAEGIIRKQSKKISELSSELENAHTAARDYRRQFEEAIRCMGSIRRWWYGYILPQFTDEDH